MLVVGIFIILTDNISTGCVLAILGCLVFTNARMDEYISSIRDKIGRI